MPYGSGVDFHANRRKWKRVPAGFDVMYRIGEQSGVATAIDISTGGVFVAVETPPRIGERVYLTFVLPGEKPAAAVKVIGEVVRTTAASPRHPCGFGVHIVAAPMEARLAINGFIDRASDLNAEDIDVGTLKGEIIQIEPDEKK
jgi:Tfp pilus assembly protein PilZ